MGELLLRRRLERSEFNALRINGADDVAHDSALACGVHRLEDEEDRRPRFLVMVGGEESLLEIIEFRNAGFEVLASGFLVAFVAGGRMRINIIESKSFACPQQWLRIARSNSALSSRS